MRRHGVLLLATVLGAGCAQHVLVDERRAPPFAGLLEEGAALRRETAWVLGSPPGAEPVRLAVEHVRAREQPAPQVVVLVGGVFSSRATWRFLVGPLGRRHDLMLLDPPGSGESDKPDPRAAGPDAYTPRWLARREMRALETWSRSRGDTRPLTLVGHSLGAAVLLRMLADPDLLAEAPLLLRRVRRLVLVSPPDVVVEAVPETLEGPATISGVEIDLARAVGLYGSRVEDGIWEAQYDPCRTALRQEAEQKKAILATGATRRASQAMVARYNPRRADGSLDTERAAVLRADLGRVRVPVLVIHGEADDTVSPENGRRLVAALPRARLLLVPRARHSPHQERAPEVADAILRFLEQ